MASRRCHSVSSTARPKMVIVVIDSSKMSSQHEYFKINSVVTAQNFAEDLAGFIQELAPQRWKVFQALQIDGQNNLDAAALRCSDEAFATFKRTHAGLTQAGIRTVFEGNDDMTASYAMVDPFGRFYDNIEGTYRYSQPIWAVGGQAARNQVVMDAGKFVARGGVYAL